MKDWQMRKDFRLSELLGRTDGIVVSGDPDRTLVSDIAIDSRYVRPGSAFVAMDGTSVNSHAFIPHALDAGATAIICKRWSRDVDPRGAAVVQVRDPRRVLSNMSARLWHYPADRLKIVGCTGTDGKTTTTLALQRVLDCAGLMTGLIGTICCKIAGDIIPTEYTTPPPHLLHELFAAMWGAEVTHCVMEVSSQGLEQSRVADVDFAAAVLTNVTEDHIEAHGSFEKYRAAKGALFTGLSKDAPAVLNVRDENYEWFRARTTGRPVSYGLWPLKADVQGEIGTMNLRGMELRIATPDWDRVVRSQLVGAFNAENLLAATAVAWALGIDVNSIVHGIETFKRPAGRLEIVDFADGFDLPLVVIDYAHNAHSMRTVLSTLRPLVRGKLIGCFGCGGNRDVRKRGPMGAAATEFCDHVVVTTDNSREEDPTDIVGQIVAGIPADRQNFDVILDRRRAIRRAIRTGDGPRDLCVVLGKGHEDGQTAKGVTHPFNDRDVALEILSECARERKQVA